MAQQDVTAAQRPRRIHLRGNTDAPGLGLVLAALRPDRGLPGFAQSRGVGPASLEWTEVFGSERLTRALLDRLTHHVHILEMNGDSYRLRCSRDNVGSRAPDDSDGE